MSIILRNKKAYFEYEIITTYYAGIQLVGSEVKSIIVSNVSISEAYCFIQNNEMFIKGMHIGENSHTPSYLQHQPLRDKKLLLKKKEIKNIGESLSRKGLTLIPLELFKNKTGFIKLKLGLGRGKNNYDKKTTIKLRDLNRELKIDI